MMNLEQICDWLLGHPEAYVGPYRDDPASLNRLACMTHEHLERLRTAPERAEDIFADFLDSLREDRLIQPFLDRGILHFLKGSGRLSDPNDSKHQQKKMETVLRFVENEFIRHEARTQGASAPPPPPATPKEPVS